MPDYTGVLIALTGSSPPQIRFALSMRDRKLKEWSPDLPPTVLNAVKGISDATWWLANQSRDSASIGWPASWVLEHVRNRELKPAADQPSLPLNNEARDKVLASLPKSDEVSTSNQGIEVFDKFARKICQSPELSYLALMAYTYRQSKSPLALKKFVEARQNVQAHLDAIDKILGSPGEE